MTSAIPSTIRLVFLTIVAARLLHTSNAVETAYYPDFTIGEVSYEPGAFGTGQSTPFVGSLLNAGSASNAAHPEFFVDVYLAGSADWTPENPAEAYKVSRFNVDVSFLPGETRYHSGHMVMPADIPPGMYYPAVVIDPENRVPEINTANNLWVSSEADITVLADGPGPASLHVEAIKYSRGVYRWGESTPYSGLLRNTSNNLYSAFHPAVVVEVFLADSFHLTPAAIRVARYTADTQIDPLGYLEAEGRIAVPHGTPAGNYHVIVTTRRADMDEGTYLTQVASPTADVEIVAVDGQSLPDLEIIADSIFYHAGAYAPGAASPFAGSVRNSGNAVVPFYPDIEYQVVLSPTRTRDGTADHIIRRFYQRKELKPGETLYVSGFHTDSLGTNPDALVLPQNIEPGDYYVGVIADSEDVVEELSTDNNIWWSANADIQVLPPTDTQPELSFVTEVLPEGVYNWGQGAFFSGGLENTGGFPSGVLAGGELIQVSLFLSEQPTYGEHVIPVAELTAHANVGSESTLRYQGTVAMPEGVQAGDYYLIALAEVIGATGESAAPSALWISDNPQVTSSGTFGLLPDLRIVDVRYEPGSYAWGDSARYSGVLRNMGAFMAELPIPSLAVSLPPAPTVVPPLYKVAEFPLKWSMKSHRELAVSGLMTLPSGIPEGDYFVIVIVDSEGKIPVVDPWHNTWISPSADINVRAIPGTLLPDLAPARYPNTSYDTPAGNRYLSYQPGAYHWGQTSPYAGRIINRGNAPVAPAGKSGANGDILVRVFISPLPEYGEEAIIVAEFTLENGLPSNETVGRGGYLALPPGTPAGHYYAGFVIDPENVVEESDTANNLWISDTPDIEVITSIPPHNVSVVSSAGGDPVLPGTPVTFNLSVSGSPPFEYQWYRGFSGDTSQPVVGATGTTLEVIAGASTSYWVRVSNMEGLPADSETIPLRVDIESDPYAAWFFGSGFLLPSESGPFDNPAGDGIANALKFVLDLNPAEDATGKLPVPEIYISGEDRLILMFLSLNPDILEIDGLTVNVEYSENLKNESWRVLDPHYIVDLTPPDRMVLIPASVFETLFLRLNVQGIESLE